MGDPRQQQDPVQWTDGVAVCRQPGCPQRDRVPMAYQRPVQLVGTPLPVSCGACDERLEFVDLETLRPGDWDGADD